MFCFRLSFFPRGVGPGGLRAGQPGRATGPGGWLRAGRANHLFNWRLGPVSPPVVQQVLQPVVQPSLQPKQSSVFHPVVQSFLQPKQSLVFQPVVQSSLQPKQSPVLQPLLRPTQSPVFQPVVQSSLQPTQSPVLQPLLQPMLPTVMPMHLNRSRRQCNEIPEEQHRQSSKIYVKLHIFIRKAKLSTT